MELIKWSRAQPPVILRSFPEYRSVLSPFRCILPLCLLAPIGALYVIMCHYLSAAAQLFQILSISANSFYSFEHFCQCHLGDISLFSLFLPFFSLFLLFLSLFSLFFSFCLSFLSLFLSFYLFIKIKRTNKREKRERKRREKEREKKVKRERKERTRENKREKKR